MNPLLRRFVDLLEDGLAPDGFVRRGPVYRYLDADGNGIALDIQRTTAMYGEVEFFVNAGVLLGPYVRYFLDDEDPRLDVIPRHGVWEHRLVAEDDDHRFSLADEAGADRAAEVVLTWTRANVPRLKGWLGDYDAMLAAVAEDGERVRRARAEQLASGEWKPGRWPDGTWREKVIRLYRDAERGDVGAVSALIGTPKAVDPDSVHAAALAYAEQRRAERKG
ncbi:hypothetical protein KZ829_18305 [Actinoplanes hulinensis]|uniref:DUF4304 domain-containing protein n=1 Tax=Actinoplanes hulinensis TaxID=1144547 RepID=A0ABS7B5Z1_9ACTN|nr:hypothetical protein [Actinoplanes hulinensis]MBW6435698.1 hypothetical protein [Actinoplanes hulinensis]